MNLIKATNLLIYDTIGVIKNFWDPKKNEKITQRDPLCKQSDNHVVQSL